MEKSFYITLPSNSSMDIYPDNTMSEYITLLANDITLLGEDWEVSLVEMHYSHKFEKKIKLDGGSDQVTVIFDKSKNKATVIEIPNIEFNKAEELAAFLTEKLRRIGDGMVLFYFHPELRVMQLYVSTFIKDVSFSKELGSILGFEDKITYTTQHPLPEKLESEILDTAGDPNPLNYRLTEAKNKVQKQSYTPSYAFVYTDIIDPVYVGNVLAPLLRMVNLRENWKEDGSVLNTVIFHKPHYVSVMKRKFNTIEINIRDDIGSKIPFAPGKLSCKLHFRPYSQ